MKFDFDFIKRFTENLGALLGTNCEIVVHDFTGDLDHTIVHIVNGAVSGRELNGCPSNLFFEHFSTLEQDQSFLKEYYTTTEDGRTIRSSSTFLTDEEGKIVGCICINMDITHLISCGTQLNQLIGQKAMAESHAFKERFVKNVQELMNQLLEEVEQEIGKPASEMDKAEKLRALAFLDSRGVLQIAKAHVRLCEFFNISKFTLYNYLEEVRKTSAEAETQ